MAYSRARAIRNYRADRTSFQPSPRNKYWTSRNAKTFKRRADKVKKGLKKLSLHAEMISKMKSETLKSKLISQFRDYVAEKLPAGQIMTAAKLLELAKTAGGFKQLIPTEGDFEMLEESPTIQEDSRIGLEMGTIYKKAIVLTKGMKKDSQMKSAEELYKTQTWPCFNSQSSKYYGNYPVLKLISSQAGTNRQGVWSPLNSYVSGGNPRTTTSLLKYNCYITPLLLQQQYYDEIRNYLMSSDTITWLEDDDNMSSDIFYAINSITDVVTFANLQKFLPVELKIYVCKCKTRTKWAPAADWFDPTGNSEGYERMRDEYIYPSGAPTNKIDPDETGIAAPIFNETSVHLGATPFYSPTFRNHWEVVRLVKQEILPTDKFELTFHREFRHSHSIRNLEQGRETLNEGYYQEGDYALIVTYKGLPCIIKYKGEATPVAYTNTREVDAGPTRIQMTSRSSINISAPNLITPDNVPSRSTRSNYISGEGRVLDTTFATYSYDNTDWAPNVMTNVSEEDGGSR